MNEYVDVDVENGFLEKNVEKGKNILDKVEDFLFPGEITIEGTGYQRNILDKRIEKYLDEHFDEYIDEFGLVRELELEIYESRYNSLNQEIANIKEFQEDMDSELESFKRRLDKIESMK
ncbi:MAG: hypothetical protein R6W73_02530 [Candidatus Saliniplasma sp.]